VSARGINQGGKQNLFDTSLKLRYNSCRATFLVVSQQAECSSPLYQNIKDLLSF